MTVRRLFLIRHGETEGNSSTRYHGRRDVPLSADGRAAMERVQWQLRDQVIDQWVASTLSRSWEGARIASGGAVVRLDPNLCEVDFGRWEGRTLAEIEAMDPEACRAWQEATTAQGFDYPEGESAACFRDRVERASEQLLSQTGPCTAAVLHKGVIRQILRQMGVQDLERSRPILAEVLRLGRMGDAWRLY